MTTPPPNASSPPTPSAQCEALFKLFEGPTGRLRLGRLLKGAEAGRLVLLRDASAAHDDVALSQAVDGARCIAHPNISKLLGVVWLDGAPQLASEYVDGVSLFELKRTLAGQPEPIEPRVAARIICDALSAVANAKDLLRSAGAASAGRFLFSDTLWIAEFGETLLMEAGVATLLNPESAPFSGGAAVEQLGSELATNDVRAAGFELLTLLTNHEPGEKALELLAQAPPALAAIVRRALSDDPAIRYADPATMSRALAGLPAELIASEREVGVVIQESMRAVLKGRRHKLSLLERLSAVVSDADESTKFFGATGVSEASQRGTLPPPKGPGENSEVITARPPAPTVPRIGPTEIGEEDETRIFKPKEAAPEPSRTVEVRDQEAPVKDTEETTERALRVASLHPPAAKAQRSRSTTLIALMSILVVLSGLSAAEYFGWLRVPGSSASSAQHSKLPWPFRLLDR
jgi:hypothetical protein